MLLPNTLRKISFFLQRLPGIGEKTANRLAFYLLRLPKEDLEEFAKNISELKEKTKRCKICQNLSEEEICPICADKNRNHSIVMVVESPLDIIAFENGQIYDGVYHVLHGKIDPLNNIRPEDIFLKELFERVKSDNIKEVIIATNPDMEGEATAMYIRDRIKKINPEIKISRLAYGLPVGASIEYADYMTLKKSIIGREEYK